MKALVLLAVAALTAFNARAADFDPSLFHNTNAYVGDTRQDLWPSKSPWTAFGRLDTPDSLCSATLIGPDLVLTAAHCILNEKNEIIRGTWTFHVGYNRGKYLAKARVVSYVTGTDIRLDTKNDWAVLRLDQRLGDRFGYLGLRHTGPVDLLTLNEKIYHVAYGSDYHSMEVPYWQKGCAIHDVEDGLALNDCSMSSGSSGSAMFVWDAQRNGFYVIAIVVAERRGHDTPTSLSGVDFSTSTANISIPTRDAYRAVVAMRRR